MDTNLNVRVIHSGPKQDPDLCQHPPQKYYTWFADALFNPFTGQYEESDPMAPPGKLLVIVCCQCNKVLRNADNGD